MSEKAWEKAHRLQCDLDYLLQERDSKPEQVNAKHAWDMILQYAILQLQDIKELSTKDTERIDRLYGALENVFQILNDAALHEQQIIDSAKLAKQIREVLEGAKNVEKDS